jgi:hypothetical protein
MNVAEQARALSSLWKEVDEKARNTLSQRLDEMRKTEAATASA